MKGRFSAISQQSASLLCFVPKVMNDISGVEEKIKLLGRTYANDLPNPLTLSTDIRMWQMKWATCDAAVRLTHHPLLSMNVTQMFSRIFTVFYGLHVRYQSPLLKMSVATAQLQAFEDIPSNYLGN